MTYAFGIILNHSTFPRFNGSNSLFIQKNTRPALAERFTMMSCTVCARVAVASRPIKSIRHATASSGFVFIVLDQQLIMTSTIIIITHGLIYSSRPYVRPDLSLPPWWRFWFHSGSNVWSKCRSAWLFLFNVVRNVLCVSNGNSLLHSSLDLFACLFVPGNKPSFLLIDAVKTCMGYLLDLGELLLFFSFTRTCILYKW